MFISNVRQGLATNSSSTHSIIISSELNSRARDMCEKEFGWDYFVAYAPESKLQYLAILLSDQLSGEISSEVLANVIVSKLTGVTDLSGYVDHQSIFKFPMKYGTNEVDMDFFNEFRDFILRPDVAIIGGNDNGGDPENHPLLQHMTYTNLSAILPFIGSYNPQMWCRKDGKHWTLFDKRNLRYTFCYDSFITPIAKYESPLLVDLKITDYCASNCSFCYQGSTKKGKVADFEVIKKTLDALKELKVLEVAIGGGNPISHPKFIEILEYAHSLGIVPNFSTRDISFNREKEALRRIGAACGNFAYSVDPGVNIEKLDQTIKSFNNVRAKASYGTPQLMNLQIFIGPGGFQIEEELLPVLRVAKENRRSVTLLGFKAVGRSVGVVPPYEAELPRGLVNVLLELKAKDKCPDVGIDTVLAKEIRYYLEDKGISEKLFTLEEGKASCYIDAVEKTIARSSFDAEKYPIDITNVSEIKTAYSSF